MSSRLAAVAVVAVAMLASVPAALGASTGVDVGRSPAAFPRVVAPVMLDDGSIVFGVGRAEDRIDVLRVAAGSRVAETVTSDTIPERPGPFFGPYLSVQLAAAGSGFLMSREVYTTAPHCCATFHRDVRLTRFAADGASSSPIDVCGREACSCQTTSGAAVVAAADSAHALVQSACFDSSGQYRAFVHDFATGEEAPVAVPSSWSRPQVSGRYVSGGNLGAGGVYDWTTGTLVHELRYVATQALSSDGTLYFTDDASDQVQRIAPADSTPTATPARGFVVAVAGGRILTESGGEAEHRTLRVWSLAGDLLDTLAHVSIDEAAYDESPAFDGERVGFLTTSCMTTRLEIWQVGAGPPPPLRPRCGQPAASGPVTVGPRSATVRLSCPAAIAEGCMGTVRLVRPAPARPPAGAFELHPGQSASVALLTGLGPRRCRTLARTRSWRVRIAVPTVFGPDVRVRSVGRRSACA